MIVVVLRRVMAVAGCDALCVDEGGEGCMEGGDSGGDFTCRWCGGGVI